MNFDLTGLFQRQSQIPMPEISSSTSASQLTHSGNGTANLNLSVGNIISGQVIQAEGNSVSVEVAPGTVLQAQVEGGISLQKGMTVSFEVSGISDRQVALRALFQNSANMTTINKALEAAELPVASDTVSMVNAMMKEGMPIDKTALQGMYRQVMGHSQVNPQDIVSMNRLSIPVTDANVKQFVDYMNMEHQIRGSVETMTDTFSANLSELISEGKVSEASALMKAMTDVFMPGGENGSAGLEDALSGALEHKTVSGKTVFVEQPAVAEQAASNQSSVQAATASLEELMRAVTEVSEEGSGRETSFEDNMQLRLNRLVSDLESLGLPAEKIRQFTSGQMSGTELLEFTNQLLAKLAQRGKTLGGNQLTSLAELLQRPEMQTAMKSQMFEQWLMTPEDVADKEKVSEFYSKLSEQSAKLTDALKSVPGADQTLMNQANNVHQNVDFMNQLNQTMSYVQLPLKLSGENAHGDLYVYTNKKSLAENSGNVSAFLHLDMDHLGPVDVYVAMQNQKVSTQFYLKDDEMLDFIQDNIGILNERLEKRGYQMSTQFSVKEKPGSVMEEILEDHRENVRIGSFSFDVRA